MTESVFRIRISTVLILLAIAGFPFAALWLKVPNPFAEGTTPWRTVSFVFMDLPLILFMLAFVVAFITGLVDAVRRKWSRIPQAILEIAACIAGVLLIPVF